MAHSRSPLNSAGSRTSNSATTRDRGWRAAPPMIPILPPAMRPIAAMPDFAASLTVRQLRARTVPMPTTLRPWTPRLSGLCCTSSGPIVWEPPQEFAHHGAGGGTRLPATDSASVVLQSLPQWTPLPESVASVPSTPVTSLPEPDPMYQTALHRPWHEPSSPPQQWSSPTDVPIVAIPSTTKPPLSPTRSELRPEAGWAGQRLGAPPPYTGISNVGLGYPISEHPTSPDSVPPMRAGAIRTDRRLRRETHAPERTALPMPSALTGIQFPLAHGHTESSATPADLLRTDQLRRSALTPIHQGSQTPAVPTGQPAMTVPSSPPAVAVHQMPRGAPELDRPRTMAQSGADPLVHRDDKRRTTSIGRAYPVENTVVEHETLPLMVASSAPPINNSRGTGIDAADAEPLVLAHPAVAHAPPATARHEATQTSGDDRMSTDRNGRTSIDAADAEPLVLAHPAVGHASPVTARHEATQTSGDDRMSTDRNGRNSVDANLTPARYWSHEPQPRYNPTPAPMPRPAPRSPNIAERDALVDALVPSLRRMLNPWVGGERGGGERVRLPD